MRKNTKIIAFLLVLSMISIAISGCGKSKNTSAEEEWPKKDITIIVGYGPGGSTDTFARLLAKQLEKEFGRSVIVSNVAGGGGAVGYAQTLASKADGYTVVVSNGSLLTLGGIGDVDYTFEDFDNIGRVIVEDEAICVSKDSSFETINDLVNYAKENPGKLKVGFAGLGGFTHLASMQFLKTAEIEVDPVGYGSGSEAVAALMGGFVDMIIQQPGEIYSQYKGGELNILATIGTERHPLLSEIPTCKEEGIDLELYQWRGISAPKGIPMNAKIAWINAIEKAIEDPEFNKEVQEVLLANKKLLIDKDFETWLDFESKWINPLIEELGLKK